MSDLVVIVYPTEAGKIKLNQIINTAAGAVSGSFRGLLIGVIFLNAQLGAAGSAGLPAASRSGAGSLIAASVRRAMRWQAPSAISSSPGSRRASRTWADLSAMWKPPPTRRSRASAA